MTPRKLLGALLVLAVIGLGLILLISDGSSPTRPFSFSAQETRRPCSAPTFLPQDVALAFVKRPPPANWGELLNLPGAKFANAGDVEIHLRPGSSQSVTIQSIRFHVRREKREPGALFYAPCIWRPTGWVASADLDEPDPKVTVSNTKSPGGQELRFPVHLPLGKPITLHLTPLSYHCNCAWHADVRWQSGGSNGTMHISDGGKDFQLTSSGVGLRLHVVRNGQWHEL